MHYKNKQNIKLSVLVVGENSFLGKNFIACSGHNIVAQRYFDEDAIDWENTDVIINFTLSPFYKTAKYRLDIDEDARVIQAAKRHKVHYVMLSSRMVYAPNHTGEYTEECPLGEKSIYGKNKIITENTAIKHLPENHTILRLSNAFGFELERPSFFGLALTSLLQKNEIVMDCCLSTTRDFLPVKFFCKLLDRIITLLPIGVYNLGSGVSTSVGEIGHAIIAGYGDGRIISTNPVVKEPFRLNVSKLQSLINFEIQTDQILEAAYQTGKLLKNE